MRALVWPPHVCVSRSAELFTQRLPHQQRVLVGLTEHQAVERMLVRAQGVDGGAAVVDDAVQQAQLGGRAPRGTHADVDADFRQALLPPDVTQFGLHLLSGGLCVTAHRHATEEHLNLKKEDKCADERAQLSDYHLRRREDKTTETDDIAMAAEPIQGCNTRPIGRKTPADKVVSF